VVLQGLQRYHPPLADLVAGLELELGHPCQANAYLTPPGAQGFAVHSDSHDVFVFQTHGSKQWEIHGAEGPGELLLEPGVVAYLPTGTPHAARAQRATSLHVTIGINQLTWRAVVERVVREAVAEVPDDHLPAGWLDDPADMSAVLQQQLRDVAARVAAVDAEQQVASEALRFLTSRPSRAAGRLRDRVSLADGLGPDSVLHRRAGVPCRLVAEPGDRVRVLLGDRSLVVPARARPALEEVVRRDALTPRDLGPHLDLESALVLARRLVREGLLRVG
jgi:bifunctional lysine-specific demethylase and histidyl-hydroxylase NO66